MTILVIAEHDNKELKNSTLASLTAAKQIDADIHLLIVGFNCGEVVEQAKSAAYVNKILLVDSEQYANALAEQLSDLIVKYAENYSHILAGASAFGKNLLPRIAALLDVAALTDVQKIISADTFERAIYAGSLLATVQTSDRIKVISIRSSSFDSVSLNNNAIIEILPALESNKLSSFVEESIIKHNRPELSNAEIIVSGGRGLGSAENFKKLIDPLADKLGAAIGASRAAVDAGYAPNDYQVGQTGKIVAPDLYIAVGISGAIQHLAGMKDSKIIVAINNNADEPIFRVADYGIVDDLNNVLPELINSL